MKQRRKTYVVGSSGARYSNLPGQRAGARDWRAELKGVLEGGGLNVVEGAPALLIESKFPIVSAHIGLGATEGPRAPWYGECQFLKRKFRCILVEQDTKHVEKLVQKEFGKQASCPMKPHDVKNFKAVEPERYQIYRTCVGILLDLGRDRPACLCKINVLVAKTSGRTEHKWHLLKILVRSLKLCPRRRISLGACNPGRAAEQRWLGQAGPGREDDPNNRFGGKQLIESMLDESWAAEPDR